MKSGWISSYGLNGNALKIIAVVSMLIDHIGVVLFPNVTILRIIGRIAFPIFAFMIAEGCAYAKNKLRYFLTIFILGIAYQGVYYLYTKEHYIGILIAFSLSIIVIYALEYFKNTIFVTDGSFVKQSLAFIALLLIIIIVYILNDNFESDYGFWGAMAPVFASLFRKPASSNSELFKSLDDNLMHVLRKT
ncbi:MAG: TraX family protein [Oscillospiraceae bacterium]|nr:TraX family protein [Oscillospiraceae bacterium]